MRSLGVKIGLLLAATAIVLWTGWDGLDERAATTGTSPPPDRPALVSAAPHRAPASPVPLPPGSPRRHGPPASIDVNRATAEELATLPGVGDTIAGRIIARRERLGAYRSVQQLREVRGIGETRLARIRPLVHVSDDGVAGPDGRPPAEAETGRRGS